MNYGGERALWRRWLAGLLPLLALLVVSELKADVGACVEAHSQGQLLRDEGSLVKAAQLFSSCTAADCPGPVREECGQFFEEVNGRLPSVVLSARDRSGTDLVGVTVSLDGKPLEGALNGVAVELDPGPHILDFVHPDGRSVEKKILIQEGARSRPVVALFEDARPTTRPAPLENQPLAKQGNGNKTLAYILGGVGVVGLASFTAFALSGKGEEDTLRATCAPNCSEAQREGVGTKYLLADISLAAATLSFAAGAYFYFAPIDDAAPGSTGETALHFGWQGEF